MHNELIFILYSMLTSITALIALYIGKEALVAYISLCAVLANVFVLKQITLFGMYATAADVLIIGSVLGLNLLQEYFGKEAAKQAIAVSFVMLCFYTIASLLHTYYAASIADTMAFHYAAILDNMPRITIASLITYFIVQQVDTTLYAQIKMIWHSRNLVLRNYFCIALTQLLDTALFGFLGLYGLMDHVLHLSLMSYSIKLIALVLVGPFVAVSRRMKR